MKQIEVGQRVKVMNQRLDGSQFVEGIAVVTKVLEQMPDGFTACQVRFDGEDETYFRWIDGQNQE
jgi:hypothetical protein